MKLTKMFWASLFGALSFLFSQAVGQEVCIPESPLVGPSIEAKVGGRRLMDGVEIQCDLPGDQHIKNVGGSDGAGLCVFTSINHSAIYQEVYQLQKLQAYMRNYPGGSYPKKTADVITRLCKEKGWPEPDYIQVEGPDIEILKLACKTGRMPGITYSRSPTGRYGGGTIAHMTSLVMATDTWFAQLDNNYIGDTNYEYMSPEEFKKTYAPGGSGWSVILLAPPPPPAPIN